MLILILYVAAFILFLLAALPVTIPTRIRLTPAGLACVTLAQILSRNL